MNSSMNPFPGNYGKDLVVTSPGEYPPIAVERPYLPYARMLMKDLASAQSEMTAVYQYLYQQWRLAAQHPELAAALRKISKVEMHHIDILGQLILLLGGDPRCQAVPGNRRSAWNGNFLNYIPAIPAILQNNIHSEQHARNAYLSQANMVQDIKLAVVLRKMAADEDVHVGIFQRFLTQYQQ